MVFSTVVCCFFVNAPNPELKLKPGLTANITIFTLEKEGVQALPNKALNFKPDTTSLSHNGFKLSEDALQKPASNQKVVWIQKDKTIVKKIITIGETDGIHTEVISGLSKDDKVVTEMKEITDSSAPASAGESSPFMPKRPGSEKKQAAGGAPK
jgi:HlyD family secretion protein